MVWRTWLYAAVLWRAALPRAVITHIQGCGVTNAVLLTRSVDEDKAKEETPRISYCVAPPMGACAAFFKESRMKFADPTKPRQKIRGEATPEPFRALPGSGPSSAGCWSGLSRRAQGRRRQHRRVEYHLALDSPEMRRVYDIAAETQVPVMMHIQNFPHFPGELPYNTGYDHVDKVLRAYPRTNFIGHGDLFWANISANVPTDRGYPSSPVKPGGLTDKWLSDFPNLYADMSANSCNNAWSRDLEFSRGFVVRHQDKMIFGSDCSCLDGKGGGVSQNNNPEASRPAGKCVARATLELSR